MNYASIVHRISKLETARIRHQNNSKRGIRNMEKTDLFKKRKVPKKKTTSVKDLIKISIGRRATPPTIDRAILMNLTNNLIYGPDCTAQIHKITDVEINCLFQ